MSEQYQMWNEVYKDSQPVDLRGRTLSVDPLFDTCLMMFAEQTERVLDFGCGTGDILFQYAQYKKNARGIGVDPARPGIAFAKETAKRSGYRNLHFFEGDESFLGTFEAGKFDGIILSNVLDIIPEEEGHHMALELNRVLKDGGCWFIKMNPVYSDEELKEMEYEELEPHMYGEHGVLRLKQEDTGYWMKALGQLGEVERYAEFPYTWQPGMNRIFLVRKCT